MGRNAGRSARRSQGGGRTWDARRGGTGGRTVPAEPSPLRGPPRAGLEAGSRRGRTTRDSAEGILGARPRCAPSPGASLPRRAGTMGAPRCRPRVFPGSPPGPSLLLFLLLLRPPGLGLASPRLLDHPAPECSQEVRSDASRGVEVGVGWTGGVAEAAVGRAGGRGPGPE